MTHPAALPTSERDGYDADMGSRIASPVAVGREAELASLRTAIAALAPDVGPVVLLSGEAGIGKSRLLAELTRSLEQDPPRGRPVVAVGAACLALTAGELPFAPVIELLDGIARTTGGDLAEEARALADELSSPTEPSAAVEPPGTADPRRTRRLRRLVALVDRIQADRDVLLVVDDLQWADPSTLDTVAYLAHRLHGERPVVVLAYRSDEVPRRHPLRSWLSLMRRRSVRFELDLGRLDEAAIEAQVTAILGRSPSFELLRSIIERADGSPLFVEELVALGPSAAMPETLRDVIAARVHPLDAGAHQVLVVAAAVGRDVRVDDLADLAGLGTDALDDALGAIIEARLLEPTIDRRGYRFRHALVLEAMTDELTPAERRQLHRRIAERLAASVDPARRPDPTELARHWLEAGAAGPALRASVDAAARAQATGGWAEAARAIDRALTLWDQATPDDVAGLDRVALIGREGRALNLAGEPRRALAILDEAIALSEREGRRDGLVDLHLTAAYVASDLGDPATADHVERALELTADGDGPERIRALAFDASLHQVTGRFRMAIERATALLALASPERDPDATAMASSALDLSYHCLGRPDEGDRAFTIARAAAARAADPITAWTVWSNHAAGLQVAGRSGAALALLGEAFAEARASGTDAGVSPWYETEAAEAHWWLGQWAACEEALRRAERWGLDGRILPEHRRLEARLAAWRGHALSATEALASAGLSVGDVEEPWERSAQAAERSELASWAGDHATAREVARDGLAALEGTDELPIRARLAWLTARAIADLTATLPRDPTSTLSGELDALGELIGAMRDGGLVPESRPPAQAEALLRLAEAELARARGAPGTAGWERSLVTAVELGYRPLEAYARFRLGEARLGVGDRDGAGLDLRGAQGIALELGASPLAARIDELARRSRLQPEPLDGKVASGPSREGRPPEPWGLSTREREVLALVALGWTNRRIGEALFITEKTTSHHVTHILDKLGVWSRTEAAVMATRAGLAAAPPDDGSAPTRS
jgi:DNA-binding CsgD family transcriptional regulator/tetratricopeptide (TPR) repeat protein